MTTYSIAISMSSQTANALKDGDYSLYAFKAIKSSNKGGQPLVWIKTQIFSLSTVIKWTESYGAYTSLETNLSDGTNITASASYPIDLGQALHVNSDLGTGLVKNDGISGAIAISNESPSKTQFTCGITQQDASGNKNMLCALPLYGSNLDLMTPVEQVLLTFATDEVDLGTVIVRCLAPSLLVRLDGETSRTVNYDINQAWSSNTEGWCTQYSALAKTAPILIQSSNSVAAARQQVIAQQATLASSNLVATTPYPPAGYYSKVNVRPITGSGSLRNGTGTMSQARVFSCGIFAMDDQPEIEDKVAIYAEDGNGRNYQFGGECTHKGPTSDFST
jgi:hypothetical protein